MDIYGLLHRAIHKLCLRPTGLRKPWFQCTALHIERGTRRQRTTAASILVHIGGKNFVQNYSHSRALSRLLRGTLFDCDAFTMMENAVEDASVVWIWMRAFWTGLYTFWDVFSARRWRILSKQRPFLLLFSGPKIQSPGGNTRMRQRQRKRYPLSFGGCSLSETDGRSTKNDVTTYRLRRIETDSCTDKT